AGRNTRRDRADAGASCRGCVPAWRCRTLPTGKPHKPSCPCARYSPHGCRRGVSRLWGAGSCRAPLLDQGAYVFNSPCRDALAKLDGLRVAACFDTRPPCRPADGEDGGDSWRGFCGGFADYLRQAQVASFGKSTCLHDAVPCWPLMAGRFAYLFRIAETKTHELARGVVS